MIDIDPDLSNVMEVTYLTVLTNKSWRQAKNLEKVIRVWCEEYIGVGNFIFRFEDYGQDGGWFLYTRSRDDLSVFKLRWGGLGK